MLREKTMAAKQRMAPLKDQRKTIGFLLIGLLLLVGVFMLGRYSVTYNHDNITTVVDSDADAQDEINSNNTDLPEDAPETAEEKPSPWTTITVKPHQSLALIFRQQKIAAATLQRILHVKLAKQYLVLLTPGQKIQFLFDQQKRLTNIQLYIEANKKLLVALTPQTVTAHIESLAYTYTPHLVTGTINTTLNQGARDAHLPYYLINTLAHLFESQIHFNHVRKGATFKVYYRTYAVEGRPIELGDILIASITTRDDTYYAVRYENAKGWVDYFTPEGQSVHLSLLRYPLSHFHISSPFSYSRMDPYTHRRHSHLGVDLAAPRDTPLRSVGYGRVIYAGRKGGYGNALLIDYGEHYHMLYGHMHKFAHGIHRGVFVKKGQVVGYVGSTGWSTGPHVHYEIHYNKEPKNPLKIKLPHASPVSKKDMPTFKKQTQQLLQNLKS